MVQMKLEATSTYTIAPEPPLINKSMIMYVCKQCNIYFPIRRMLELHDCKVIGTGVEVKIKDEDDDDDDDDDDGDENKWQVETLDENLPILAKVKRSKKDLVKLLAGQKCPFCPFSSDNSSTYHSHVKRKHYEDWLHVRGKENLREKPATASSCPRDEQKSDDKRKAEADQIRGCPHCSFETRKKSTLYSHINRTHKGKQRQHHDTRQRQLNSAIACTGYACNHCTFAAATMSSLRYHTAREHGEQKRQPVIELPVNEFDCEQCDYKSKSRKIMQHHLKSSHQLKANDEGMFTCHVCSYETLSKMGLQRHVSIKHDKPRREAAAVAAARETQPFSCQSCSYRTYNAKVLEWHSKRHDELVPDENDKFCNDCDFCTWNKAQLLTHIKRNHKAAEEPEPGPSSGAEPPRYSCDRCDYTSKNKHAMKVHVIRRHTEGFNHACELCGKKYKVKADLTNHTRFQHREQPIMCDVCGKTCRNSNLLYLHQKFAHYKPEFECHICHRRMVSQANLDDHVLKQHERRQDVVCEECGKSFTRQTRLKIHMRTHLGLRPHTCKICGKTFARRNGLRQHLLIHTGKRPYVCDICGKDFTQKTGLISHRKSHPGSHPPLPRVTIGHVLSGLMGDSGNT